MMNDYDELFTILEWAAPGCLGNAGECKERKKHFNKYIALPMKVGQSLDASESEVAEASETLGFRVYV